MIDGKVETWFSLLSEEVTLVWWMCRFSTHFTELSHKSYGLFLRYTNTTVVGSVRGCYRVEFHELGSVT